MLEIIQIPVLNDNYIYLIHEPVSEETGVVDPAIAEPVLEVLKSNNWTLNYVLNTHHHSDHIGANIALKQQTGCKILGYAEDCSRIPGIDIMLKDGEEFKLGNETGIVMATPGHTLGHIVYYFKNSQSLFCGDTLFSMGCGRLFEGTPEQMWQSLQLLKTLPPETRIYCAHEYTQANAKFAITLEPENRQLQQRIQEVNQLRLINKPTVPSTIKQELATNPFLRSNSLTLQKAINKPHRPEVEVFTETRVLKDSF